MARQVALVGERNPAKLALESFDSRVYEQVRLNVTYLFELFIANIALEEPLRTLPRDNLVDPEELLTFLQKSFVRLVECQFLQVCENARIDKS